MMSPQVERMAKLQMKRERNEWFAKAASNTWAVMSWVVVIGGSGLCSWLVWAYYL